MRLLVVGCNGLLGSNVVAEGRQRGWDVFATYHTSEPNFGIPTNKFDLRSPRSFGNLLDEYQPDVVVNCAAMTDVDECETDPKQARAVNGEAPGKIAARCATEGVDFVHVSTDYVFDGTSRQPYVESTVPNPIQKYGESKLVGEQAVLDKSLDALIVRLSFVWGVHLGKEELAGFPAWVRSTLHSDEAVPLFTDQWITPTRAGQAAETLLDLTSTSASGRYHIASRSCVTPYEFGDLLARRLGSTEDQFTEGSMNQVDREARRPAYTCLDCGEVESKLGRVQPTLRSDLDAVSEML